MTMSDNKKTKKNADYCRHARSLHDASFYLLRRSDKISLQAMKNELQRSTPFFLARQQFGSNNCSEQAKKLLELNDISWI